MQKSLFLLGGHDLEMLEIKKLLEDQGESFVDRGLSWSDAELGAYTDLFDDETLFIGIELREDVVPPAHYEAVDHHGAFSGRTTSLEQVAKMLGVKLDRRGQLVAANDRGHIRAMKCLGAGDEEIREIRRADRAAQGVGAEEEARAEAEAANVRRSKSGLFVIDTTLEHFSPLVERIEERPLLVRGERQWSFYGDSMAVMKLADGFGGAVSAETAYYGGNPVGYFGWTEAWFEQHAKEETMAEIETALKAEGQPLYSYHTFMFPFRYEKHSLQPAEWKELDFSIDSAERFNEKNYFYTYVQKVLFAESGGETVSTYREYREQRGRFTVSAKNRAYELEIDGISLRLFGGNIGILSFNLINRIYRDPESVLVINDFGRRLYPSFLAEGALLTAKTKAAHLPQCVEITLADGERFSDDFSRFDEVESLQNRTWYPPAFIAHLLEGVDGVEPVLDDRMYVLCHLMDNDVSVGLRTEDDDAGPYAYETDDFWYRYIFVDGGEAMCRNPKMKRELIMQSTYVRWSGYGTLFGVTRYSFMLLSDASELSRTLLNAHMRTVYFQLATLLLAYRAMMLHFSDAVAGAMGDDDAKAKKVFEDYLAFQNRIYFKEVTAQEQGIELFNLGRLRMRLDEQLEELDHDIAELHGFIDLGAEKKRNEKLDTLNRLAGYLLPATVVTGIFGMNVFPRSFTEYSGSDWTVTGLAAAFTVALTWFVIRQIGMKSTPKKGAK